MFVKPKFCPFRFSSSNSILCSLVCSGFPAKTSFYGSEEYKLKHHDWVNVNRDTYAREWPDGWIGIDADVEPSRDVF